MNTEMRGTYPSAAVDSRGWTHVFDEGDATPKRNPSGYMAHKWWNGSTWQYDRLDSPTSTGQFSSTMFYPLYGGQVRAFNQGYSGGLGTGEAMLRHAWWQPQGMQPRPVAIRVGSTAFQKSPFGAARTHPARR